MDSNSVMLEALVRRDGGVPSPALYLRDRFATVRVAPLSSIHTIVTDSGIDPAEAALLRAQGLELIIANN